ncbi:MAG: hypothetical protein NTZ93_00215 [Candidatus Beckwithbacteria bacterium]|nr:hypothetical protein [Candidatus Beckwithbacteria bacterium]
MNGPDVPIIPRQPKNQPKEKKPPDDKGVVLSLLKRIEIAFDAGEELPTTQGLTEHQMFVYRGMMASRRKEQEEYEQQWQAQKWNLTSQTFCLDLEEQPKKHGCGNFFVRDTVVQRSGRRRRKGQTRLLVNEYCPSCGFEASGKEFQFWVPDSQVVKRE